jgi:hypothetical protein
LLATLLSNRPIGDALMTELEATGRDPLKSFALTGDEDKPKLTTPSIAMLIQSTRSSIALTDPDRDTAIDAMRVAADKRVEGILGNSRRRHYGHAALLVACVWRMRRRSARPSSLGGPRSSASSTGVAMRSEGNWLARLRVWE